MTSLESGALPQKEPSPPTLHERIAELMEPKPAAVPVSDLRATYRDLFHAYWVTTHEHESPLRWWEAQIGTDWNEAGWGDGDLCIWNPSLDRDPEGDDGVAMLVVEKLRADGWVLEYSNQDGHHAFFWKLYHRDDGRAAHGESFGEAICKAALKAVSSPSHDDERTNG